MFNFFKSKKAAIKPKGTNILRVKNEVFQFFEQKYPEDIEKAKAEFVNLTGQFDEEHEYFESKLDDFRNWYLFFYGGKQFLKLERAKHFPEVSKNYEYLVSGVFSVFTVQKIRKSTIVLKDIFTNVECKVEDEVSSLSLQKYDVVQTSLYQKDKNLYEFGLSMISHPQESQTYIKSRIKCVQKKSENFSKEEFFESLMAMRYQFFKYKQLEIAKIYSDRPLFNKKTELQNDDKS